MKSKLNQCVTDGAVSINAPPIVRLFVFPQWDIYTGAEIILDETLYVRMGKKKKKLKERERMCHRGGVKRLPRWWSSCASFWMEPWTWWARSSSRTLCSDVWEYRAPLAGSS